jgi:hypothetical protein
MSTEQPPRRPTGPVPQLPNKVPNLGDVRPSEVDNSGSRGTPPSGKPATVRPVMPDANWMADRAPPTLHPLGPVQGQSNQQSAQRRTPEVSPERSTTYRPPATESRAEPRQVAPPEYRQTPPAAQTPTQPPRPEYRPKPGQEPRVRPAAKSRCGLRQPTATS